MHKEMWSFMNIDNSTGESFFNRFQSYEESTGHVTAISDHQHTAGGRSIEMEVPASVMYLERERDTFSAEFPVGQNRFRRLADRAVFDIVAWLRNIRAFCVGFVLTLVSICVFCIFIPDISVTARLVLSAAAVFRAVMRSSRSDQLTSEMQCAYLGAAVGLALSPLIK